MIFQTLLRMRMMLISVIFTFAFYLKLFTQFCSFAELSAQFFSFTEDWTDFRMRNPSTSRIFSDLVAISKNVCLKNEVNLPHSQNVLLLN